MKIKFSLVFLLSFSFYLLFSQVPQGFNYQAIARDGDGNLITDPFYIKVEIQNLAADTVFWIEEHNVTPNEYGLISFVVGQSGRIGGTKFNFSDIDWGSRPKYLKTSADQGSGYTVMGTTQIWSVPYALSAKNIEGPINKLQINSTVTNNEEALFQIKNKNGQIVFAVYNEAIRAYVSMSPGKAVKGGFAIGGFTNDKGMSQNLLLIHPDSIRLNVNNMLGKGVKGGFAIGGFTNLKGSSINQDFMYITPEESGNGQFNTFLGYHAGHSNVEGSSNIFLGYHAGYLNYGPTISNPEYGLKNIYVGTFAGEKNLGGYNVVIGDNSATSLEEGSNNVMIGKEAGKGAVNSNYNSYLGALAGQLETGSDNVMIGYNTGSGTGESDLLVIGNRNNTSGLITGYFTPAKLFLWADVGINNNSPTEKLDVNGNARFRSVASGTPGSPLYITPNGTLTTSSSDIKLKENISTLNNCLNSIMQLRGVSFTWKSEPGMGQRIGFIAQEVEQVIPELVFTNPSDGYKGVDYAEMAPVIVEAMKEQQRQIAEQQSQIDSYKSENDNLKSQLQSLQEKVEHIESLLATSGSK